MRIPFNLTGTAIALLLGLTAPHLGAAQDIGVVASVTPQMSGQPPGQGTRILGTGVGIVTEERIRTHKRN